MGGDAPRARTSFHNHSPVTREERKSAAGKATNTPQRPKARGSTIIIGSRKMNCRDNPRKKAGLALPTAWKLPVLGGH